MVKDEVLNQFSQLVLVWFFLQDSNLLFCWWWYVFMLLGNLLLYVFYRCALRACLKVGLSHYMRVTV